MGKIDILIVDDSPAFNHLTKLIIERAGLECNVIEMSNGQRALKYLEGSQRLPEVILLDINMPVMDGFDFLEEYNRSRYGKTHIYMLTSSAQEVDKIKVRSFGIVMDYFEKPLTKENLQKIIADLKG